MITGCFEGGSYILWGTGQGFRKPTAVLDRKANTLRLGQYWDYDQKSWTSVSTSKFKSALGISVTPVDWDDDGDLDLLLGANGGGIFVRINEGSPRKAAYATVSIEVKPGGESYRTSHCMPVVADWDGDGRWDLLTGSSRGDVYWMRNIGERGKPRFAAPETLVKQRDERGSSDDPSWPGQRTQVAVADWNGDGHLDLLIGDYQSGQDRRSRHGWVWLMERKVETTAEERL